MRRAVVCLLLAFQLAYAVEVTAADNADDPGDSEEQVVPPPFPKDGDLAQFHVNATTANRYFVDGSTLAVGKDGIVRYVLVIRASGGATNVSYEGLRCTTGEYRVLASGHADGTWGLAKMSIWRSIEAETFNRYRATLFRELFCPLSQPIASAEEGRQALRLGKHPVLP